MKVFFLSIVFFALNSNELLAQNSKQVVTDKLIFGNTASETAHQFFSANSLVDENNIGDQCRKLMPPDTATWQGNSMNFILKVDPVKQNYITVKLWGDDVSHNQLLLMIDGKQIGYRHLGDIEALDVGADYPLYNGRYHYKTSPLPLQLTKGKTQMQLAIRSSGPIWGYGSNFAQYQKNMTDATRGIYALYSHTHNSFTAPADERQGNIPKAVDRKTPGKDVLGLLKERVNKELDGLIKTNKNLSQVQMQFLAKAYSVKWSSAYKSEKAIERITKGLDSIFIAYKKNPKLAEADPATWNADWFGLGIVGEIIYLLNEPLRGKLDEVINYPDVGALKRKDALASFLVYCRDWHTKHRRMYTNQSMINDLYGIYYANKGLYYTAPDKYRAEKDIRRYLYESVGLQKWRGHDSDTGSTYHAGNDYWLLTKTGLTKELGYVGNYGEVLDWVAELYLATKSGHDEPGDELIKKQIEKIALARMPFRYAGIDADGFTAMRIETQVGWRDTHYPGDVTYVQRSSWDGSPLQIVAATMHPQLIGYAQQMFADNQFFASIEERMKDKGFRVTAGLLIIPDQYELIKDQPNQNIKMPMSKSNPNFVFADEEDGVVAIKNGDDYLYASLYWRARNAVNNLAKLHFVTPKIDYVATVFAEQKFDSSGLWFTRPDYTNFGFAKGGPKYPDTTHSAHTGEKLPIAKIPAGILFKPGDESPYAGKADYYKIQYGNYIIAMNASKDKTFELVVPDGFKNAINLVSKENINVTSIKLMPQSTVVLYKK